MTGLAAPEWTIRRRVWPPSEAEGQLAVGVEVELDAALAQLADGAGASSTRTCTALGRHRPRPAAIVSAAWRAVESPGSSTAARPPCAQ